MSRSMRTFRVDLSPFMPHFSILAGVPQSDQYIKLQGENGCEFKVHDRELFIIIALNSPGELSKGKKKKKEEERGGARSTESEPLPCIRVFRDRRGARDTQEGEKRVSRDSRVFLLAPSKNAGILSSLEKKKTYSVGHPRSQDSLSYSLSRSDENERSMGTRLSLTY